MLTSAVRVRERKSERVIAVVACENYSRTYKQRESMIIVRALSAVNGTRCVSSPVPIALYKRWRYGIERERGRETICFDT